MKKKIIITTLSYMFSIVILVGFTYLYINHKDNTLREQAYNTFDIFFKNQNKYIDTQFSGRRIKYSLSSNPEKKPVKNEFNTNPIGNFKSLYESDMDEWNDKFSDIYKFYKIDETNDGWQLFVAEKEGYGTMILYSIYPSWVGYKKQESSYMYNWLPAVETCVNEAYDFWTNNSKSNFFEFYKKGNESLVYDLISNVRNEYYNWYGKDKIQPAFIEGKIGTAGYMHNGYYKTFIEVTKYSTYEIEHDEQAVKNDRNHLLLIGGIILTAIFLCFIIFFSIVNNRKEKLKAEPLLNKLKKKCNPANFMDPYDEIKVEKANIIFEELTKTNSSDIEALKTIRKRAIEELGVNFINNEYIEELKAKCSPQQFLEPYNAEKVRIANIIFNKLINNMDDVEILEEIEKEIKEKLL